MKNSYHYHSFDAWLKALHGERVQKISLDANAGCPNRDGTISTGGCSFCDAQGAGSGLMNHGLNLTEQWQFWREQFVKSDRLKNTHSFLAYMQSFSNTYGSAKRLRIITSELQTLKNIVGLSLGTRPDCIDSEKLQILSKLPWENTWLEFGVQSMNDKTLKRISRGHDAQCSKDAIIKAHEHGLKVCAHLMAALPGENEDDFLKTVKTVCELPISGIKFHGLYVCKNTKIAQEFLNGTYVPMEKEVYIDLIAKALTIVPSHVVIHRLSADFTSDELIAPDWAKKKGYIMRSIDEILRLEGLWQGCKADVTTKNPYNKNNGTPVYE